MIPPRTLVIIPAYNEEASLPAVLKELAEQTPEYDVLVVSDGSTDRTAEISREAGVHVAVLPFNLGIGGALRTGFSFAVRHDYERAAQFDADGQHDPLALDALLAGIDAGADMVIGSRFTTGGAVTYEVSGIRRRAMRLLAVAGERPGEAAVHRHQLGLPRLLAPDARALRGQLPGRVHGLGRGAGAGLQRRLPRRGGARQHPRAAPAARRRRDGSSSSTTTCASSWCSLVSTTSRGQRARRVARRSQDS